MKIKYPRYTREQNLSCKLSNDDIREINVLDENNISRIEIAKTFEVSITTIHYWCLTKERRKEKNKQWYLLYDKYYERNKANRQYKSIARKYKLMPEFREYTKQFKLR